MSLYKSYQFANFIGRKGLQKMLNCVQYLKKDEGLFESRDKTQKCICNNENIPKLPRSFDSSGVRHIHGRRKSNAKLQKLKKG